MSASVRRALGAIATIAVTAAPSASSARGVAVRVVIAAPVVAPATAVMPPALWRRLIERYVGGTAVAIAESSTPTLDDCRAAGADLLVSAPFALAPKLPGLPGSSDGRVSATTHVVAISCATGAVVLDRIVPLESDPPSDEEAGDFERDPELVWDHGVAVALARGRIDNALVRRQATIALAASIGSGTKAADTKRAQGPQIPVYAATPVATRATTALVARNPPTAVALDASRPPLRTVSAPATQSPSVAAPVVAAAPATSSAPVAVRSRTAATPAPAVPLSQRVATRDVTAAPIARLVDLIDVSRIAGVTRPFAFLNVRDPNLQAGDRLLDFADASHVLRAKPIELTVTENFGTYVQIVFDATGDAPTPAKGDLVQKAPPNP